MIFDPSSFHVNFPAALLQVILYELTADDGIAVWSAQAER